MGRLTNTVSGNIASFKSCTAADIQSLKCYFEPVQGGSGDPSPSNVRNISGWNSLNTYICGKNLLNPTYYTKDSSATVNGVTYTHDGNGTITLNGKSNGTSSQVSFTWTQPFDCNYYYCGNVSFGTNIGDVYIWDSTAGARPTKWDGTTRIDASYLTHNLCEVKLLAGHHIQLYVRVYSTSTTTITNETAQPMLLPATCTDTTFDIYRGTTIPITFPNNETIYGGYVDIVEGKIHITHKKIIINGDTTINALRDETTAIRATIKKEDYCPEITGNTNTFSSYLTFNNTSGQTWAFYINPSASNNLYLRFPAAYNTTALISTYLNEHPLEIIVPINTTDIQISSQQLKTLMGQNTIQSTTNGQVEVEYDLHETKDIVEAKKRIALNQPHLATINDTIAHFNTDMTSNLKQAIINFSPIQSGSGDPSPSNIKNINGWTKCNLFKSKKNLFNFNINNVECNVLNQNGENRSIYHTGIISNGQNISLSAEIINTESVSNTTINIGYLQNTTLYQIESLIDWSDGAGHTRTVTIPRGYELLLVNATNSEYGWTRNIPRYNIQIEIADAPSTFESYYGTTIPVTFPATKNLFDEKYTGIVSQLTYHSLYVGEGVVTASTTMPQSTPDNYSNIFVFPGQVTSGASTGINDICLGTTRTVTPIDGYITIAYRNGYGVDPTLYHTQIEKGSSATVYEPYGTIYGGYINLTTGEVIKEWEKVMLKNQSWYNYSNFQWFALNINKDKYTHVFCNCFPVVDAIINPSLRPNECINTYINGASYADKLYFWKTDGNFTSVDDFKNWINGLEYDPYIVYKLATPIEYTLTPQQISTLKGINNIWSSANGTVDIKYWTH